MQRMSPNRECHRSELVTSQLPDAHLILKKLLTVLGNHSPCSRVVG